jgi:lactate permease
MVGRQLPIFSLIIPFWVVAAFSGWRGMLAVWPAALTAGAAFALPQFLVSNLHGPWLVDTISGASSMLALVILLRFWKPRPAEALVANGPAGLTDSSTSRATHQVPGLRCLVTLDHPYLIHTCLGATPI